VSAAAADKIKRLDNAGTVHKASARLLENADFLSELFCVIRGRSWIEFAVHGSERERENDKEKSSDKMSKV
jgi:hypothetical protein